VDSTGVESASVGAGTGRVLGPGSGVKTVGKKAVDWGSEVPERAATVFGKNLTPLDMDEEGEVVLPTTAAVIAMRDKQLDPSTPMFRHQETKVLPTLPSAIQMLQLDQPFGMVNLKQCYYLQKTGKQALLLLYKSGYITNSI
jgi:hypothetical protein